MPRPKPLARTEAGNRSIQNTPILIRFNREYSVQMYQIYEKEH